MLWYKFAFSTPFLMSRACALDMWQQPSCHFGDLCQTDVFLVGNFVLFLLLLVRLLRGSTKHAWYAVFFFSLSYICVIHVSARQPGGSFEGNEAWGAWAPQTPLHTSCELLKCLANGTGWESSYQIRCKLQDKVENGDGSSEFACVPVGVRCASQCRIHTRWRGCVTERADSQLEPPISTQKMA